MMDEQMNIDQKDKFPEACLHYECEQALLRGHFEEPLAEEEWAKFRNRLNTKKRSLVKRRIKRWVIGSVSVAAAVLLVVMFAWNPVKERVEDSLTLFTATEATFPVIVEEQPENTGSANTTIVARNKKEKVKQGVVYSAKKADYTRQSGRYPRRSIVSIPCGQVYKLVLNDSTEVWLNADSRLTFPTRFTGTKRLVKLEGEAYFKVAHNENMPFVIQTEKLTAHVLGTEFNMKAYKNSGTQVTLVEGAVKICMPEVNQEVLLTPGENMTYVDSNFYVKKVNTYYCTQWRNGFFYFDDMYLADILSELGRWYNMTIEMEQDSLLLNLRLHFVAERNESFEQLVENMNAFEYLSVFPQDGKWIVRRKK